MKLAACILPLLVVGCASNPTTSGTGPADRCETTSCFYERDVREFEVVNRDTVIVYVGQQRCPFVVQLRDLGCDVRVTPQVQFFQTALGSVNRISPLQGGQVCDTTRGLVLYAGIVDPSILFEQEEIDTVTGVRRPIGGGIGGGRLDRSIPVDPTSGDVCLVDDVRSINDDQLLELYVEEGVTPPPPPIGPGQLEVPEQTEEVTGSSATDAASATEEKESAGSADAVDEAASEN